MKSFIHTLKEKAFAAAQQQEIELRQKEERLRQLEEASKQARFPSLHPIRAIKEKSEINKLRKEIEAYKEKRNNKRIFIGSICLIIAVICFSLIMSAIGKDTASIDTTTSPNSTGSAVASTLSDSNMEPTDSPVTSSSTHLSNSTLTSSESITPAASESISSSEAAIDSSTESSSFSTGSSSGNSSTASSETTNSTTSEWTGATISANDLSITTVTDYAHTDSELILLGADEGVTITITAYASNITLDDLGIVYDEKLLHIDFYEPVTHENSTEFQLYVTGKVAGNAEIVICTVYDIITMGEDAEAYILTIRKLDATEGRVVYVTPTGEKYHFNNSCAGDNATKTTYRDATIYEYEPCGNCTS